MEIDFNTINSDDLPEDLQMAMDAGYNDACYSEPRRRYIEATDNISQAYNHGYNNAKRYLANNR